MKKESTRLIGYPTAMTEYPEILRSPFDRQPRAELSLVMIDQQGVGLDRRELHRHQKHKKSTRAILTKAGMIMVLS